MREDVVNSRRPRPVFIAQQPLQPTASSRFCLNTYLARHSGSGRGTTQRDDTALPYIIIIIIIIIIIFPVLNSQGMKKIRYAIEKNTKIKLE